MMTDQLLSKIKQSLSSRTIDWQFLVKLYQIINLVNHQKTTDSTNLIERLVLRILNTKPSVDLKFFVFENSFFNLDEIYQITKKLWEMDKTRYPLFRFSDFEDFYKKNILSRQLIGILGTIDHKEWSQPWHLDNRFIMISGSINIQDNETSTYFSKENYHWLNGGTSFDHCKLIYQGRKTKFSGTAWINTEHTWHSVPRITEDQRKTILFNVFL